MTDMGQTCVIDTRGQGFAEVEEFQVCHFTQGFEARAGNARISQMQLLHFSAVSELQETFVTYQSATDKMQLFQVSFSPESRHGRVGNSGIVEANHFQIFEIRQLQDTFVSNLLAPYFYESKLGKTRDDPDAVVGDLIAVTQIQRRDRLNISDIL